MRSIHTLVTRTSSAAASAMVSDSSSSATASAAPAARAVCPASCRLSAVSGPNPAERARASTSRAARSASSRPSRCCTRAAASAPRSSAMRARIRGVGRRLLPAGQPGRVAAVIDGGQGGRRIEREHRIARRALQPGQRGLERQAPLAETRGLRAPPRRARAPRPDRPSAAPRSIRARGRRAAGRSIGSRPRGYPAGGAASARAMPARRATFQVADSSSPAAAHLSGTPAPDAESDAERDAGRCAGDQDRGGGPGPPSPAVERAHQGTHRRPAIGRVVGQAAQQQPPRPARDAIGALRLGRRPRLAAAIERGDQIAREAGAPASASHSEAQ